MRPIELGTFQIEMSVKNKEMQHGFPRMEFLQDNLREVLALIPDGEYQWRMTMTLANALRPDKPIQEYIDAGVIICPTCGADRAVARDAHVAACGNCKDGRHWNLMVTTH